MQVNGVPNETPTQFKQETNSQLAGHRYDSQESQDSHAFPASGLGWRAKL